MVLQFAGLYIIALCIQYIGAFSSLGLSCSLFIALPYPRSQTHGRQWIFDTNLTRIKQQLDTFLTVTIEVFD
jgi:hypothetical protein